jgi:kynurenine formamidase
MTLADRTPPTLDEYAAFRERFCNWDRWGPDDEMGTLNFITDDSRRAAFGCVEAARSVSLARPLDTRPGPANPFPAHHFVATLGAGGMLDYVGMFIHGLSGTHIDALCHIPTLEGDRTWRGIELGADRMPRQRSGTVDFWRSGIVTRGVLYDVPRFRRTEFVTPGAPVHGWELADIAAAQGVEPRAGDAVIIRSGHGPYWAAQGTPPAWGTIAGVHASCLEFLYDTDAGLLVWDMGDAPTADQGIPNPGGTETALHVHHIALPYMGLPIVDNVDAEPLAVACAEEESWAFLFVVAPLCIPGGTGSPINPLAIL